LTSCFYINLPHRRDRLDQIRSQVEILEKLGVVERSHKIEAVYTPHNGALGCAASHIKAISAFLFDSKDDAAIIFEDDFEFIVPEADITNSFNILKKYKSDMDLVQLAYNKPIAHASNLPGLIRIRRSLTTSGYWVTRTFAYQLLECFARAHRMLSENQSIRPLAVLNMLFAIDTSWHALQASYRCFGFHPCLGKQRKSYSDILNEDVDYRT
jgi:GR25 family glycosyltransferase involved in LPS biosynthesis